MQLHILPQANQLPLALRGSDYYQPKYNAIVNATNCTQAIDTLDCLRHVPFSIINAAINTTNATTWFATVDGDFIQRYPSIQLAAGDFLHVPIISGTALSPPADESLLILLI